jgi:hypothetical protein
MPSPMTSTFSTSDKNAIVRVLDTSPTPLPVNSQNSDITIFMISNVRRRRSNKRITGGFAYSVSGIGPPIYFTTADSIAISCRTVARFWSCSRARLKSLVGKFMCWLTRPTASKRTRFTCYSLNRSLIYEV